MATKKVVASLGAPKTEVKEEVKAVVKEVAKKVAAKKAEAPKAEAKKVEAPKAEAKKAVAPKAATKKAEAPKAEAKKTVAKKAPAKKAPVAKKTTAAVDVKLQFAGKEYTQEDLVKIANDVWVYDFDKKASELKKVELFVKPEESKVYYVFNGDITGDFDI